MRLFDRTAQVDARREPTTAPSLAAALPRRSAWPLALTLVLLLAAVLLGAAVGPAGIPLDAVVRIIVSRISGADLASGLPRQWQDIVWEIRLPRVILAGLVGASLALAGATYQAIFRNPLADPYLIGVAAGAGLGAAVAVVAGWDFSFYQMSPLTIMSFAGALAAAGVSYLIARVGRTVPVTTLLLAGVAIGSLASSATSYLIISSGDKGLEIYSWILGGFNDSSWGRMWLLVPYLVPAAVLVLAHGRILNVMQLDEEQAQQLGVNVERVKLLLIGVATLATAAAVSVAGVIGFVGLIVPHVVRLAWGPDHRQLLPLSMVLGAVFLILADVPARTIDAPSEIPVGIVTALCGTPFFLLLLRLRQRAVF
ncbi:MAG TPA: iron chelate uptake ABC transporter family permease subunit [Dehalococcoidia bacterium]|nr:iron chelate uptake ABC transporter family permease subunit [Dehalococcoidia bacterium]